MNNRIFFLNPPKPVSYPSFRLGFAYLSAVLRKHGYEVKIMDAAAVYNPRGPREVKEAIRDFRPLFIGVALEYDFISEKYKLIRELKGLGYPVVVGGPQVNILPREAIENGCDIVSIGEGEETIVELARAFSNGGNLEEISGLGLRRKDGGVIFTPRRKEIQNLDEIPFPDYSDFNVKDYTGTDDLSSNKTYFNVFTSRGCPYRCTYCSASRVWKGGQRNRSARNVFDEIVYLTERCGARYIAFMDNEPLIDKQRMYELCELLCKNRVRVKISSRARIDNIDEDLLKRMMESGFYKLAIGVESGDDETLRKVKRFYTQKDVLKAMEILDRVKFPIVHFNNLIGFPWEGRKHFDNTLKMNLRIPKTLVYFVNVFVPEPMPGTPLYEDYYEQYGFKDWWFDPNKHLVLQFREKEKPFYQLFLPKLKLKYLEVNHWKYSEATKSEILKLQLKLQEIAYRKNQQFLSIEVASVFFLIRLSIKLYRVSPKLERIIFAPLQNKFIRSYAKKFVFKEQE